MSTQLPDSFLNEQAAHFLTRDAWQTWTPTVTQGVAVTATIVSARYVVLAQTVILLADLSITGAGTLGQNIVIGGIPFAPLHTANAKVIGTGIISDTGVATYQGALIAFGASDFRVIAHNMAGYIGAAPSFALANTDQISFVATYERA